MYFLSQPKVMETGVFQNMLQSLRQTFQQKLPDGISEVADARLQRTLAHYIRELSRVHGSINERDVLRESYDSMTNWFRRNTEYLLPSVPALPLHLQKMVQDPLTYVPSSSHETAAAVSNVESFVTENERKEKRLSPAPSHSKDYMRISSHLPVRQASQPKDFLQKQEDIVKYRETEFNLILNSKDRDWLHGTSESHGTVENRYNFTIQLNGGARPQGAGIQATIVNRFRNIVRIELIKILIPVEGLDVVVPREDPTTTIPDQAFSSALTFPYVHVLMDELQGNNYGTNDTIDKSFAICQYDATWRTDSVTTPTTANRGYTLFFPKFMKAQRIYAPTPLASIQKMSFQILTPENQLLSKNLDFSFIQRIVYGNLLTTSIYAGGASAADAAYLFIQTKSWFPIWAYSQLDRVMFNGVTFTSVTSAIQTAGEALNRWLQREEGHVVIGIAHDTPGAGAPPPIDVTDGGNNCGYANWIIIRNLFEDPTSGTCTRELFALNNADEDTLSTEMRDYESATGFQKGGVLNLSRQVQIALRIVTRDVDSASNMRPDNV
jgi:hypothetical protein